MEFTLLPRTNTQKSQRFAHFSINSTPTFTRPEAVHHTKSGFYYIGKNSANIEKLVKIFKRGYASEMIENAKSELKRCLLQEKNNIPEIIFCETKFDLAAIRNFRNFLNSHSSLSSIPFVLDASNLTQNELELHKKAKLSDEILFLQETGEEKLVVKTKFLKKIKSRTLDLEAKPEPEKNGVSPFSVYQLLKRGFDIFLSLSLLLLVSPIFLLIALAINLESKGPVFYISKRAGRGYRIFNFYKFRTMYVGADKNIDEFSHLNQYNAQTGIGPLFFKIDNDPRITKVGSFLRKSSLDELPQLINVLLGDMSLVGNRPLPLYEAATLTTDDWATRFMAPAGITGLWQIKKRGQKDMSVEERINLDIVYAKRNNFMYDLWIIANTPYALIQKSNA
jgi:lipopolysaccharide/colanic/teichoic acid biosynthesis glycosyltransferase